MLNTFCESNFCFNLDDRKDRWETARVEFERHGIDIERISAINGQNLNLPRSNNIDASGYVHPPHLDGINLGALGLCLTHISTIRMAKAMGITSMFLFEDDVKFVDDLNQRWNAIEPQIPNDWDMMYLGGNHFVAMPLQYSDNLYKMNYSVCLHAVAIKDTIYDRLLDRLHDLKKAADNSYAELHKECNAFVTYPHLATQLGGYSSIQTSEQHYGFLDSFESSIPEHMRPNFQHIYGVR